MKVHSFLFQCAQILGLDFAEILQNCYSTKDGTNLQLQAEKDTKEISPKFIPTIVYDGVSDTIIIFHVRSLYIL